jgi:hypothetical protein
MSRMLVSLAMRTRVVTDKVEPNRVTPLRDNADPTWKKSRTLNDDPQVAEEKALIELPRRA